MESIKARIHSFESMGTVDGPGIRTVIFFDGCNLRCKYCHNPETWQNKGKEYSVKQLKNRIMRNKPYFEKNGGVTFSGGEPLLHQDFLTELCKELKKENINIAIDTAGIGKGNYQELLKNIDLILLDVKALNKNDFNNITQTNNYNKYLDFIKQLNDSNKPVWIRQVIIPKENDTKEYAKELALFLKQNIKNIKKIEFLPFHTMAFEKYQKLNIKNPYQNKKAMDKEKCKVLEEYCISLYEKD